MKKITILFFTFLISCFAFAQGNDPVLLSVAGDNITKSEFEKVFKKNNTKDLSFDRKSVTDYLNLFINYKLKVKEATELGMDTAKSFTDELSGYRKQLAQPYLVDKDVTEALLKEAYDRMKKDVRASHILLKCAPDALPKDTLAAYNKAIELRKEILKGGDFSELAKQKSDDPSAKENGGDLGYFTSLQMVYPFETAAYSMKAGEVSMPVRTKFGYHLIKVTDFRPAAGEVHVAHIMVKVTANAKEDDSSMTKAKSKIDEIYAKLKAGGNFEDLAKQFSDDQGSAKNGGALPVFGTGRMVPEFEQAAFALQNPGDYSAPIRTSYGYHIIKLLEKKPMPTYEEMQNELKTKVQRDSRAELSKTSKVNSIKQKYQLKEFPKTKDDFNKIIDSTLVQGKWDRDRAASLNKVMFTLMNTNYTQKDFAAYMGDHQTSKGTGNAIGMMNAMYSNWLNETCIAFEEARLDENYPDFKSLMQEYRDGILLFELTDKKVWSKAVKDTSGLKEFYEKNKTNYMWGERADAAIYSCANSDISSQVRKILKKDPNIDPDTIMTRMNKDSQLNLTVKWGKFAKGESDILDSIPWVKGITKDMKRDDQIVFVQVKSKVSPEPKTLDEAKGLVTADYQSYLEKEWIESLRQKYPVKVNDDILNSIIH